MTHRKEVRKARKKANAKTPWRGRQVLHYPHPWRKRLYESREGGPTTKEQADA